LITIFPATAHDAAYVGRNLRAEDEREAWAATGCPPSRVLHDSFRLSRESYVVFYTPPGSNVGRICAVFGVADDPCTEGLGVVWMLCTPLVAKCPRALIQTAPQWLDRMAQHYPLGLHNFAHAANHLHIRWCRKSGFHEMTEDVTIRGESFIHIYRPPQCVQ
jgi:hypothetical protein